MSPRPYTSPAREELLADLNPPQREAVTHGGGPLLVVAGAGTGKTRVLTRRVAWVVAGGLPARSVLAITFTNKAAQVLRGRLAGLPRGDEVQAGTFHGFCALLLRRYGERIGLDPRYTILDRDDQSRLLRTLITDHGLKDSGLRPRQAAEQISRVKNAVDDGRNPDFGALGIGASFQCLLAAYRERLAAASLLDFDDLLLEALRLVRDDEATRLALHDRFAHVLVDEYQDTNAVQRRLLLALVGPSHNITVVGDPDQSIYSWRGALLRNILEFDRDFPGVHQVVLEQNYRSTGNILAAAEAVIAKNRDRYEKRLFSERPSGALVTQIRCLDGDDEAQAVADTIAAWQREGGSLSDAAVVYRVNSMSRPIELALRSRRVPYVVVAGVEFFQRREVKDVLAYARLLENPRDDAAFQRVVNVPRRGIGETSLQRLRAAATRAGTSLLEAARMGHAGIRGRARSGLGSFVALLDELRELPRAPVAPLLQAVVASSGYLASLEDDPDDRERSRLENVKELLNHVHQADEDEPEGGLTAFLERAALVSDQDAYETDTGRVSLMSVHAAKGLEFPLLMLTGAETGLFPHSRSIDDPAGLEEERRLFYVAMTRAMDRLVITHASQRVTYMGREVRAPSVFLRDVPPDRLDVRGVGPASTPDLPDDGGAWLRDAAGPAVITTRRGGGLTAGDRVAHPYFGEGWLRSMSGAGSEARVTVEFDNSGTKQMMLRYAKLERVR